MYTGQSQGIGLIGLGGLIGLLGFIGLGFFLGFRV